MSTEIDPELVKLIAEHYDIEITALNGFDELTTIYTEMRGADAIWQQPQALENDKFAVTISTTTKKSSTYN